MLGIQRKNIMYYILDLKILKSNENKATGKSKSKWVIRFDIVDTLKTENHIFRGQMKWLDMLFQGSQMLFWRYIKLL